MKKNGNDSNNKIQYLPIGMCLGMGVGVAIGAAMDNIGVGMCLGIGIGLCFGSALNAANRKQPESDPQSDGKTDESTLPKNQEPL